MNNTKEPCCFPEPFLCWKHPEIQRKPFPLWKRGSHKHCSSHCCRSGRWAVRSEGAAGLPPLFFPFPCKVAASTCIIQIAADVAPGRPLNQQILPCSSFTPPNFFSYLSVLPACFCCCLFAQVLPLCPSRGRRHLGGCLTTVRSSHQAARCSWLCCVCTGVSFVRTQWAVTWEIPPALWWKLRHKVSCWTTDRGYKKRERK